MAGPKFLGLLKNRQGVAAIEFALIAPVFILLLDAILEVSLCMLMNSVVENAASIGSRYGKTGQSDPTIGRQQAILDAVQDNSYGLLDPSAVTITLTSFSSLSSIGHPEPCISPATPPCPGVAGVNFVDVNGNTVWDDGNGTPSAGGSGDIVIYSIRAKWPIINPMLRPFLADADGNYIAKSVVTVRNEPF